MPASKPGERKLQILQTLAGMLEAPVRLMPRASAIAVMVLAMPMVMQVPWLRAMPPSTSIHCAWLILPARRSSQYFQASEPEPSGWPFQLPLCMGPAGR